MCAKGAQCGAASCEKNANVFACGHQNHLWFVNYLISAAATVFFLHRHTALVVSNAGRLLVIATPYIMHVASEALKAKCFGKLWNFSKFLFVVAYDAREVYKIQSVFCHSTVQFTTTNNNNNNNMYNLKQFLSEKLRNSDRFNHNNNNISNKQPAENRTKKQEEQNSQKLQ